MGHFIYDDELDRIEFPDGEWIDIKRQMSYADQQMLAGHYMKVQTKLDRVAKTGVDIDFDIESGNIVLLVVNIKAWSLKDREGKAMPISKKSVGMLDRNTSRKLLDEIQKRNPPPKG